MNIVFEAQLAGLTPRKRAFRACKRCRARRIRCFYAPNSLECSKCRAAGVSCIWDPSAHSDTGIIKSKRIVTTVDTVEDEIESIVSTESASQPTIAATAGSDPENIYESAVHDQQRQMQFVGATQPLSVLLSRDAVLSLDGVGLGYFRPWRTGGTRAVDSNLREYIRSRGCFRLPLLSVQKYRIQLFLDNLYPLYPVVSRSIIDNLGRTSPLLVSAMMLAGIRFDSNQKLIRKIAEQLFDRCNLLSLVEPNKVVLIQAYLLMSIHEEGSEGPNRSRELITKACSLCMDLALTNSDDSTGDLLPEAHYLEVQDTSSDTNNNEPVRYSRNILRRILWVSFCCDRMAAVTSGKAAIYSRPDFIVDEPSIKDFEGEEYSTEDFAVFSDYYEIACINERILSVCYRPPKNRVLDDFGLESEILKWKPTSTSHKYCKFLQLCHCISTILFFRARLSSACFQDENSEVMKILTKASDKTLQLATPRIQHVLALHGILHVIVLSYLSLLVNGAANDLSSKERLTHSLECLKQFASTWWMAAACYLLCTRLQARIPDKSNSLDDVLDATTTMQQDLDIIGLLNDLEQDFLEDLPFSL